MDWLNVYGLIIIIVIMIPNIIYFIKVKDGFNNKWHNKIIELLEQIGRYGCFAFMIINIPTTYFGWLMNNGKVFYLIVNIILIISYCLIWIICFNKNSLFRSLALSIIPSVIFLFSGIMLTSILLIISSIIFMPMHILISVKNSL